MGRRDSSRSRSSSSSRPRRSRRRSRSPKKRERSPRKRHSPERRRKRSGHRRRSPSRSPPRRRESDRRQRNVRDKHSSDSDESKRSVRRYSSKPTRRESLSDDQCSPERRHSRRNWRERDSMDRRRPQARRREPRRTSPVQWGRRDAKDEDDDETVEKEKPNFQVTGALAADTNTFKGVVIKYTEPPEARKPKLRWALFPFKAEVPLPVYYIHRQSAYLFGRDRCIADIPIDHPSCSKQHAVFQYRGIPIETTEGRTVRRIKPYIIDLGSANGTLLNGKRIEPQRYYELFEKDVIRFGYSTRDYVLLNEKSTDSDVKKEVCDDVVEIKQEPAD